MSAGVLRRKDGKLRKGSGKWLSVDWSLSNVEIAKEIGVRPCTVSARRKIYHSQTMKPFPARLDKSKLESVDWSLPLADVAEHLGVHVVTASRYRGLAKGIRRTRGPNTPKEVWSKVDWHLPNCEIAEELGVSMDNVRQQRRKFSERGVVQFKRKLSEVSQLTGIDWGSIDWTLTNRAIAERVGVGVEAVRQQRLKSLDRLLENPRKMRFGRIDWDGVDWGMRDNEIARSLKVSLGAVRYQRKKHK